MLALFGVAAEVSSTVVRLLSVGSVPREAMRWLLLRQSEDPQELRTLLEKRRSLSVIPSSSRSCWKPWKSPASCWRLGRHRPAA